LLVHLEFVTVHPFYDGNGRLGRLLMNLVLLSAGYPWVTIRSDERIPFFSSIERAQVEDDTRPFIEFLWHLIRRATADLAAAPATRSRSDRRK
jgi:Fic family protein